MVIPCVIQMTKTQLTDSTANQANQATQVGRDSQTPGVSRPRRRRSTAIDPVSSTLSDHNNHDNDPNVTPETQQRSHNTNVDSNGNGSSASSSGSQSRHSRTSSMFGTRSAAPSPPFAGSDTRDSSSRNMNEHHRRPFEISEMDQSCHSQTPRPRTQANILSILCSSSPRRPVLAMSPPDLRTCVLCGLPRSDVAGGGTDSNSNSNSSTRSRCNCAASTTVNDHHTLPSQENVEQRNRIQEENPPKRSQSRQPSRTPSPPNPGYVPGMSLNTLSDFDTCPLPRKVPTSFFDHGYTLAVIIQERGRDKVGALNGHSSSEQDSSKSSRVSHTRHSMTSDVNRSDRGGDRISGAKRTDTETTEIIIDDDNVKDRRNEGCKVKSSDDESTNSRSKSSSSGSDNSSGVSGPSKIDRLMNSSSTPPECREKLSLRSLLPSLRNDRDERRYDSMRTPDRIPSSLLRSSNCRSLSVINDHSLYSPSPVRGGTTILSTDIISRCDRKGSTQTETPLYHPPLVFGVASNARNQGLTEIDRNSVPMSPSMIPRDYRMAVITQRNTLDDFVDRTRLPATDISTLPLSADFGQVYVPPSIPPQRRSRLFNRNKNMHRDWLAPVNSATMVSNGIQMKSFSQSGVITGFSSVTPPFPRTGMNLRQNTQDLGEPMPPLFVRPPMLRTQPLLERTQLGREHASKTKVDVSPPKLERSDDGNNDDSEQNPTMRKLSSGMSYFSGDEGKRTPREVTFDMLSCDPTSPPPTRTDSSESSNSDALVVVTGPTSSDSDDSGPHFEMEEDTKYEDHTSVSEIREPVAKLRMQSTVDIESIEDTKEQEPQPRDPILQRPRRLKPKYRPFIPSIKPEDEEDDDDEDEEDPEMIAQMALVEFRRKQEMLNQPWVKISQIRIKQPSSGIAFADLNVKEMNSDREDGARYQECKKPGDLWNLKVLQQTPEDTMLQVYSDCDNTSRELLTVRFNARFNANVHDFHPDPQVAHTLRMKVNTSERRTGTMKLGIRVDSIKRHRQNQVARKAAEKLKREKLSQVMNDSSTNTSASMMRSSQLNTSSIAPDSLTSAVTTRSSRTVKSSVGSSSAWASAANSGRSGSSSSSSSSSKSSSSSGTSGRKGSSLSGNDDSSQASGERRSTRDDTTLPRRSLMNAHETTKPVCALRKSKRLTQKRNQITSMMDTEIHCDGQAKRRAMQPNSPLVSRTMRNPNLDAVLPSKGSVMSGYRRRRTTNLTTTVSKRKRKLYEALDADATEDEFEDDGDEGDYESEEDEHEDEDRASQKMTNSSIIPKRKLFRGRTSKKKSDGGSDGDSGRNLAGLMVNRMKRRRMNKE